MAKGLYSGSPEFRVNEFKVKNRVGAEGAEIQLFEGSDNGTNKVSIVAPDTLASDVVITLPSTTGTLGTGDVTGSSTTTFTNKTFNANGTGNSITNIDVADLANGTDGQLITWDANGAPATVATGTSGHVLTSNGAGAAPTFQAAAGGGGLTQIATATASASSELELTGITTGYKGFKLVITNLLHSSNAACRLTLGTGVGPTYSATKHNYGNMELPSGSGAPTTGPFGQDATYFTLTPAPGFAAVISGDAEFGDLSGADNYKRVKFTGGAWTAGGGSAFMLSGMYNSTTAVTAMKLVPSAGTFTSGTVTLYGIN